MNTDTYGDVKFSGVSKGLLHALQTSQLTMQQFLLECAYWSIKIGFEDMRPRPLPTKPETQAFSDYEALPYDKRLKVDFQVFVKNPEINEYYAQVRMIQRQNERNLAYLKELLDYIPDDDIVAKAKLNRCIIALEQHLREGQDNVDNVRSRFNARYSGDN